MVIIRFRQVERIPSLAKYCLHNQDTKIHIDKLAIKTLELTEDIE